MDNPNERDSPVSGDDIGRPIDEDIAGRSSDADEFDDMEDDELEDDDEEVEEG